MNRWIPKMHTKQVTVMAFLIALEVILTRFYSLQTPIIRIGFGFVPIAMNGMLFGPLYAGLAAVIGDIIGMTLAPAAPYFPGFTLTAFLTGVTYGVFFYKPSPGIHRIFFAAFVVCVFIQFGLDTYWVKLITGKAFLALLPTRIFKTLVMIPIQVFMIYTVKSQVLSHIMRIQ